MILSYQIQQGQHDSTGNAEEGNHNAVHGGQGNMGNPYGIQQPDTLLDLFLSLIFL